MWWQGELARFQREAEVLASLNHPNVAAIWRACSLITAHVDVDDDQTPAMTQAGIILVRPPTCPRSRRRGACWIRAQTCVRSGQWSTMLTGMRAFKGEDVSDTLAAILRAEPDWAALPVTTPTATRRLLHRCLEKNRVLPRCRRKDPDLHGR